MTTTTYQVTGMTCSHCEAAVTSEVTQIGGVESVQVSAVDGRLVITSRAELDDATVLAAIDEAGYEGVRV